MDHRVEAAIRNLFVGTLSTAGVETVEAIHASKSIVELMLKMETEGLITIHENKLVEFYEDAKESNHDDQS